MTYPFEENRIPGYLLHLQPYFEANTMYLHYQGIFNSEKRVLNSILRTRPHLQDMSLRQLYFGALPFTSEREKILIRNYSASIYSHQMFFDTLLTPDQVTRPEGALLTAVNNTYGSFEKLKRLFKEAANMAFRSGWIFLCTEGRGDLHISVQSGNDLPAERITPIAVVDIYEHSYYLQYNANIDEYIESWFMLQNYPLWSKRFVAAQR